MPCTHIWFATGKRKGTGTCHTATCRLKEGNVPMKDPWTVPEDGLPFRHGKEVYQVMKMIFRNAREMGQIMRALDEDKEYLEIPLDHEQVRCCKLILSDFLSKIRKKSADDGNTGFYLTMLIMMYAMSTQMIEAFGVSNIKGILETGQGTFPDGA